MQNAKRRNPETGTSTKSFVDYEINSFQSFRYRELEDSRVKTLLIGFLKSRNDKMQNCNMEFGDRDMEFQSFGDCDMESQDISSQELPKSRNAEMRNCDMEFRGSQHGVSGICDMRNREMPKGTIVSLEDSKGKMPKSRQSFD